MIDVDNIVLDEYEQDIEDHAEEWIPVSAEEDARMRALLSNGGDQFGVSSTLTITLDDTLALDVAIRAHQTGVTPEEVAVEMIRQALAQTPSAEAHEGAKVAA